MVEFIPMNASVRMMKRLVLAWTVFLFSFHPSLLPGLSYAAAQADQTKLRLLFQFNPVYSSMGLPDYLPSQSVRSGRYFHQIAVWLVEIPAQDVERSLRALQTDPQIAWAQRDGLVQASDWTPDDPFYMPQQTNLRVIGMPYAWGLAQGASDWPIAVLDTGADLDHPDLDGKLWANPDEIPANVIDDDLNGYIDDVLGWNFVAKNEIPQDDYSHGSHVAGVAAARTNNQTGIAGVALQTPVMALKVLDSAGNGLASDVAEGILYAVDNGARILNLSLGSKDEFLVITHAVRYAHEQGCLVIAATGNTGGAVEYPAAIPEVLAIAATNNSDIPASFSNRGPQVDLSAPGVDIFSLDQYGFYGVNSGTSFSTPHVSGVAALVWGYHPDWTAAQVTEVLTSTAHDVWSSGRDDLTGWGRVDAAAAIRSLSPHRCYLPVVYSAAE